MIISENRAACILFNILKSGADARRWIIPANCCNVIPATFFKARVPFETADISNETYCLDLQAVREKLGNSPSRDCALLLVYSYGTALDLREKLRALKKDYPGLWLIEDRCLCKPEFQQDTDSPSDITLFSTGYAKYVDAGFGGYAFANDNISYNRHDEKFREDDRIGLEIKANRSIARQKKMAVADFASDWLSTEANFMPVDKYFLKMATLRALSESQKKEINQIYQSAFEPAYCLGDPFNVWRFNILVNEPGRLLKNIFAAELYASRHYCPIGHYIDGITDPSPKADFLYQHIVNLFNDRHFSAYKAEITSRIVKKHVARYGYPDR